jgi:DNA-binding SARP family transcriptional activator
VRFRLLGSLEVTDDAGNDVPIRGSRLRRLLAALLTWRNTTVSRDALVEDVWNGRPPPSASHGLDVLACRLRSLLSDGPSKRVLTRPGGYALMVRANELDVLRFEAKVSEGLAALAVDDLPAAVRALRSGLAEWHGGGAYGELAHADFAVEEALRLDEARRSTLELLFECELRLGRHREIEPEIDAFVEAYPLREQARAALMVSLYRSGRQADALAIYRAGARALAEQGLEPGAELRALHRAILRHDRALDPPTEAAAHGGGHPELSAA